MTPRTLLATLVAVVLALGVLIATGGHAHAFPFPIPNTSQYRFLLFSDARLTSLTSHTYGYDRCNLTVPPPVTPPGYGVYRYKMATRGCENDQIRHLAPLGVKPVAGQPSLAGVVVRVYDDGSCIDYGGKAMSTITFTRDPTLAGIAHQVWNFEHSYTAPDGSFTVVPSFNGMQLNGKISCIEIFRR